MFDLIIIGGSAVPICFAQGAISKSRILDFVVIAKAMNKIGTATRDHE